jgi:hypothetical protein
MRVKSIKFLFFVKKTTFPGILKEKKMQGNYYLTTF